jgi:hypothetical protein
MPFFKWLPPLKPPTAALSLAHTGYFFYSQNKQKFTEVLIWSFSHLRSLPCKPLLSRSARASEYGAYTISALENLGYKSDDIRQVVAEMKELFDWVSVDEAKAYYNGSFF